MEDKIYTMPAVALRGMTILPGMVAHFDISRERSIKAVETAMMGDQLIFLVTQKNANEENPQVSDLFSIGVVANIRQVIKLQNDIVRVLVEGSNRAELYEFTEETEYIEARIISYESQNDEDLPEQAASAMCMSVQETFAKYAKLHGKISREVVHQAEEERNLSQLLDYVGNNLPVHYDEKQKILEAISLTQRYEVLLGMLLQQIEILAIKKDFQKKVQERVEKHQKEYVLREQLALIREELGETNTDSDAEEYEKKLKELQASKEVKDRIHKEIQRFKGISANSSESTVSRGYIETLLELPWEKESVDNKDLEQAKKILDEDHYGLDKVKERILEFLAVRNLTGKGESPIICLVGPPGTGKTSIARSIAKALDKEYVRISLGGVRDEAEIRGHRRTYIGAMPGRIMEGIKRSGVSNPVVVLDEVDKLAKDYGGDPASALLEVLDPEQNSTFTDHYMNVPYDLSNVLFVCTANSTDTIPEPLLNRMEVIDFPGYTAVEKFHIARKHLLPKAMDAMGIQKKMLKITDGALRKVIEDYTMESGVRGLKKQIDMLCRSAAVRLVKEEGQTLTVNKSNLKDYLGRKKLHHDQKLTSTQPGVVTGLAWTQAGGEILFIETKLTEGEGKVIITGQLGDVMKESVQIALTLVKSLYPKESKVFQDHDLHIHVPEGAVPKDGPSAGITLTTALASLVTGKAVSPDYAMTGEVSLRGGILPIGGLPEKLMAAQRAGITKILIPFDNADDLEDVAAEVKDKLKITPVKKVSDVLKLLLG